MSDIIIGRRRPGRKERVQLALYRLLRILGWIAVTLLAGSGLFIFIAFLVGNFTLSGTLLQLDNLASRYVVAGPQRQGQFEHLIIIAWAIALTLVGFFRRASLLSIFNDKEIGGE